MPQGRVCATRRRANTRRINPWDYDKSLAVDDNTAGVDDKPDSYVHNYKFIRNENGFVWDKNGEYYGSEVPPMTYEEVMRVLPENFRRWNRRSRTEGEIQRI